MNIYEIIFVENIMADIRDILELERPPTPEITKETILGPEKIKKKPITTKVSKRPEGMHREVFALLYTDNKDAPPLFPTNTGMINLYYFAVKNMHIFNSQ
jgi:hypothetical protein